MGQATIDIKVNGILTVFEINELDFYPDADGYIRYLVKTNGREAIIYLNEAFFKPPVLLTEEDAIDYFERMNYPEQQVVFCQDHTYLSEEVHVIGRAIVKCIFQ